MKGSPMQRNFGIGSPAKQGLKKEVKSIKKKTEQELKDEAVLSGDVNSPYYPKKDPKTGEYPTYGPPKKGSDWGKKKPE